MNLPLGGEDDIGRRKIAMFTYDGNRMRLNLAEVNPFKRADLRLEFITLRQGQGELRKRMDFLKEVLFVPRALG